MLVVVVSGSRGHSIVLGGLLSSALGCRRVGVYSKRFPDGEAYVRVEGGFKGEVVVLVQSMESPQVEGLFEVLLLADALYEGGASEVILYAPYLPYARQDK
ncbi:MAG: ribose-phosphate pyrophosphokinase-like domain-containing protein, partial [Acidilobaceae archaeon]